MRREGRLHGYEYNRELFMRVKTSNKPTNRTKATGKCPRARCGCCHFHPVNKSLKKGKGQSKAKGLDVTSNHRMHDWGLGKHHMKAVAGRRALLKGGDWLGDPDLDEGLQDEMHEYFDRWMQRYYVDDDDAEEKCKEVGGEQEGEGTLEKDGEEGEREIVEELGETTDSSSGEFDEGDEDEERSLSDWLEVGCEEETCSSEGEEDWYIC